MTNPPGAGPVSTDLVLARRRTALLGLALGDALSWPALFHRSYAYPFWTRRLRREMDAAGEDAGVLKPQMPFSLNQPPDGFSPCPTDDAEWAAFVMQTFIENDATEFAAASGEAWAALADSGATIRGSVATQAALANLRKGLTAPVTGHDNPHYFDDGACVRAIPIGVWYAGTPGIAIDVAGTDAAITNAKEGLVAAQMFASVVSSAVGGASCEEAIALAIDLAPTDGWLARQVDRAMECAAKAESITALSLALATDLVNREYNFGTTAVETVAVVLAIVQYARGDVEQGIQGALAVPKLADSAAALAGALCGALSGGLPGGTETSLPSALRGVCIPRLAGHDYVELVDEFIAAAPAIPSTK